MAGNSLTQSTDLSETQATDESVEMLSDGSRFQVLKDVMNKTFKSFTRNLRLMRAIPDVDKSILKQYHKQTMSQLETSIQDEFSQMCEDEKIEYLLNNLDKLEEQNMPKEGANSNKWRPSGDITSDLRAHVVTLKQEKLKVLQKVLADKEARNKMLKTKLQKKEDQLKQTVHDINYTLNGLRQSTQLEKTAIDDLNLKTQP